MKIGGRVNGMKRLLLPAFLLPLVMSQCSCPTDYREVVQPEIKHAADVATLTPCQIEHYGTTLLAHSNDIEITRALLAAGAKPDGKLIVKGMSHNGTALLNATEPAVIKELLQAGASSDMIGGADSHSPLCHACENGHNAKLKLLLDAGADPNQVDSRGTPPLCFAAEDMNAQGCRLLLAHGAKPDLAREEDATAPLLCAMKAEGAPGAHTEAKFAVAQVLLRAGADPQQADAEGCTPLHLAPPELIPMLTAAGADVNARDMKGRTPLFYCNSPQQAEVLLRSGAELNALDQFGNTPFDMVQNAQVKSYLLIRGASSGHAL